jgi:hypothetical protein
MPPVTEADGVVHTDAGMCVLWNPSRFRQVVDYDTWEPELLENVDIARHVAAGSVVPIGIRADGIFAVLVRCGSVGTPAVLNKREQSYVVVTSDPYLFESDGRAHLTGIEHVVTPASERGVTIEVPKGRWSAVVHLIDWQAEPGSMQKDGQPSETALPDFVVVLNPTDESRHYRLDIQTFDRPG